MGPNRFESGKTGETRSCPEEANLPQEILVPQATATATATAAATATATTTATAAATTAEIRSSKSPTPSSPGRHQSHWRGRGGPPAAAAPFAGRKPAARFQNCSRRLVAAAGRPEAAAAAGGPPSEYWPSHFACGLPRPGADCGRSRRSFRAIGERHAQVLINKYSARCDSSHFPAEKAVNKMSSLLCANFLRRSVRDTT